MKAKTKRIMGISLLVFILYVLFVIGISLEYHDFFKGLWIVTAIFTGMIFLSIAVYFILKLINAE